MFISDGGRISYSQMFIQNLTRDSWKCILEKLSPIDQLNLIVAVGWRRLVEVGWDVKLDKIKYLGSKISPNLVLRQGRERSGGRNIEFRVNFPNYWIEIMILLSVRKHLITMQWCTEKVRAYQSYHIIIEDSGDSESREDGCRTFFKNGHYYCEKWHFQRRKDDVSICRNDQRARWCTDEYPYVRVDVRGDEDLAADCIARCLELTRALDALELT